MKRNNAEKLKETLSMFEDVNIVRTESTDKLDAVHYVHKSAPTFVISACIYKDGDPGMVSVNVPVEVKDRASLLAGLNKFNVMYKDAKFVLQDADSEEGTSSIMALSTVYPTIKLLTPKYYVVQAESLFKAVKSLFEV